MWSTKVRSGHNICIVSVSFDPNLAPLPFLAKLKQKIADIRWIICHHEYQDLNNLLIIARNVQMDRAWCANHCNENGDFHYFRPSKAFACVNEAE